LIGGILSSILLILGFSILLGGLNRESQHYNVIAAQVSANLMSLAATSLLIPTASHLLAQSTDVHISKQSRGAAFVLLAVYASSLFFQFYTHSARFNEPSEKSKKIRRSTNPSGDTTKRLANMGAQLSATFRGQPFDPDEIEDNNQSSLSRLVMVVYLTIVATLTAFCTQFAVDSIDALSQKANVSKPFIGLILLPILNNDLTPISHAIEDKMDQTIIFTIGKCLQTSLFVTPLMVIIAWGMGLDLTLSFNGFEIVSLLASMLLLNYLIVRGTSSWYDLRRLMDNVFAICIGLTLSTRIQGVLLIADWLLIALAAFYAS